jgi:carbon storage regulator
MLVLSRKKNQSIRVGNDIVVKVVEIRGNTVRLAFDAPPHVAIHRSEVRERIQREGLSAPTSFHAMDVMPV